VAIDFVSLIADTIAESPGNPILFFDKLTTVTVVVASSDSAKALNASGENYSNGEQ